MNDWIWWLFITPLVLYELACAFWKRRTSRTISENVRGWEKGRPVVRVFIGFWIVWLFGHLVWPQWG